MSGSKRIALSNQTNLELAPVPVTKKGEGKIAVVKPSGAAGVKAISTARRPLLETANRQPAKTEAEPGACKVKQGACKETDSTVQEPPVEEATVESNCDDEIYYLYLMESEKKECYVIKPGFLSHQPKVNATNRRVVVDWLVKVHQKFDMQHETLFIAIDTLDRYLQVL